MTTLAVLQPNFLPWRGTFDLIRRADVFVLLDTVQYTKNDWRNRNRILLPDGRVTWLTVPVSGSTGMAIRDARIDYARDWRGKHLRTVQQSYGAAPHGPEAIALLSDLYAAAPARLVDLTVPLTRILARKLGCGTPIHLASELGIEGDRNTRLIGMAQHFGADTYLSGPAARNYIDQRLWAEAGISVAYITYPDYPPYPQIAPGYTPGLSVLDLICMTGPDAARYIRGDQEPAAGAT